MGSETLNEKRYKVADLAPAAKATFIYEYDFGDGWQHEVVVEKVLPAEEGANYAVCLAGESACPPEDVGGIGGYVDFLRAIRNSKHPEHRRMLQWEGGSFNPQA